MADRDRTRERDETEGAPDTGAAERDRAVPADGADHGPVEADATPAPSEGAAGRLEASHVLAGAWRDAVIDVTFPIGELRARIDTAREMEPVRPDEVWTVHGRMGRGTFAFELPRGVFEAIAVELPDEVDLESLSERDAALVIEHLMSAALDALEKEVGEPVEIESVEPGPLVSELEPIVASLWVERQRRTVRAVLGDPMHMLILTEWMRQHAMADEFAAGEATRVEVGPIELPLDDLDAIDAGDAIAIGTEPGKKLRGRLVRPTGRTVPVTIDTSQVIVEGPMREAEPSDPDADPAALGVAIGTVRLLPSHLVRAQKGGRFIMERNADNACALMLGGEVLARGELTLIEGQLGVEVLSMGDGPASRKPSAGSGRPVADPAPSLETPSADPGTDPGAEEDEWDELDGEAAMPAETFRVG